MLERSGFGTELAEYDGAAGDPDSMKRAMSNEFLHALAAVGSPSDVRDGVRGYLEAGATSPCVSPIARTDFDATLRAAAPTPEHPRFGWSGAGVQAIARRSRLGTQGGAVPGTANPEDLKPGAARMA